MIRVCGELANDGSGMKGKGGVVRYLDWMCVAMAAGAGSLVRVEVRVRGDGWMEATVRWFGSAPGQWGLGEAVGSLRRLIESWTARWEIMLAGCR